jgi:ABC-type multidrug transport system permease subunit
LRPSSALPLLLGVVFTAAAATFLGVVSSNPKTFIVGFLTFWYIALSDKGATPALDFAGWFGKTTPAVVAAYAAVTLALLAAAQVFHASDLRRRW